MQVPIKLLAEAMLDNAMLPEGAGTNKRLRFKKMVTPGAKREAVAHLCTAHEVSQRRACKAIGVERTLVRYRSVRPDDSAVRIRLRELSADRHRFGYRRLHVLLSREGLHMNHKKLRRLYAEERLQVRRRKGRKRALGTRTPMALPQGPNQRWSLDFVSDAFSDGRRFRIFTIVDDFTRECLALIGTCIFRGGGHLAVRRQGGARVGHHHCPARQTVHSGQRQWY